MRSSARSLALLALALLPRAGAAGGDPALHVPGLLEPAEVTRDGAGIAHVRARNEHDLFFLQGWVHAEDRLFQMDATRRQASGTLAELLGPAALPGDVQLRTLGLRRAAERSLPLLSTRVGAALAAYADGVNAFVAGHPLPPEYAALELTRFAPWTPLDTVAAAKLITFGLAFDLGDIDRTVALASYQQAGAALGLDGSALFFEDLFRSAPFDPASTIPDALRSARGAAGGRASPRGALQAWPATSLHPRAVELGAELTRTLRSDPFFRHILVREDRDGSNQWVVSGKHTRHGAPLLASDPHLDLGMPSTFYPVHLRGGAFDVIGNSFAGVPLVIVGHNRRLAWGATVDPIDVTDVFQERVVPDTSSPSGLSTVFQGRLEHVIPIPERYAVNQPGDGVPDDVVPVPPGGAVPAATLIVPRRNQGPIVTLDAAAGIALSVQYTGFSGTREIEAFFGFDLARDLGDFQRALQSFDVGSQNFCYADHDGNIAYFAGAELPIREDLQQGRVVGLPPFFIRDGTGGNEWLPVQHPQPGQAIPYEILPAEEMPHLLNPPAGFIVNSNNDPVGITLGNRPLSRSRPGGGILYLAPGFDAGFRAGRVTRRLRAAVEHGEVTFEEMQSIQADVVLLDAQVLAPSIVAAFAHARRPGAPAALAGAAAKPGLAEAVARLARWDGSTPTGIPEGYDARDRDGRRSPPPQDEIERSVAATLYSTWRGQIIGSVIDARLTPSGLPLPPDQQALTALRNLLDEFPQRHGVGASGLDFFPLPGVAAPEDRRDVYLLASLGAALDLLSGPGFDAAFHGSRRQEDWRWGKLHRIVFAHLLGGPFSVPPAFGEFPAPLPGLTGIPTDGGFETVDASAHGARASTLDGFMFGHGPSNRLVVELSPGVVQRAESVWPGGASGVPGQPNYLNLLPLWLTNDTVPLPFLPGDLARDTTSVTRFAP